MEDDTILFHITRDQAFAICNHYNKNINDLEEYKITELLDKIIDELAL